MFQGAERFQIATDSTPNKRIRQTEPRRARVGQACATGSSVLAKNHKNVETARPTFDQTLTVKGWKLNNAQIDLYQWWKFSGIAGRQDKAPK